MALDKIANYQPQQNSLGSKLVSVWMKREGVAVENCAGRRPERQQRKKRYLTTGGRDTSRSACQSPPATAGCYQDPSGTKRILGAVEQFKKLSSGDTVDQDDHCEYATSQVEIVFLKG